MADPEADRNDIYEAKEAFGCLIIAGCHTPSILQFVEASLGQVPQPVEMPIQPNAPLSGLSHWDHRSNASAVQFGANTVGIVTFVGQQHDWLWQVVVHDPIKSKIVRCLAGCDVRSHRQPSGIYPEVGLGREAAF